MAQHRILVIGAAGVDITSDGFPTTSRKDLAALMLEQIGNDAFHGKGPIAYRASP